MYQTSIRLFSTLSLLAVLPAAADAQSCTQGSWDVPFDHAGPYPATPPCAIPARNFPTNGFNAIHMSLIPKGPDRGKILVWDAINYDCQPQDDIRILRYT